MEGYSFENKQSASMQFVWYQTFDMAERFSMKGREDGAVMNEVTDEPVWDGIKACSIWDSLLQTRPTHPSPVLWHSKNHQLLSVSTTLTVTL